jgi:XTP/dITP diphosphohydrolase
MFLYVATTNPGKLRDFAHAAKSFPSVAIVPLANLDSIPAPAEDADTFVGNATLKAVAYSLAAPGQMILADDSGLEVDALHGAPGVRSARYAEDRAFTTNRPLPTDQRNNLCLLDALASTREADRTARYRCTLALAKDGVVLATADGTVEGEILAVPRGSGGFGYDPLFLLPDEGLTMAEIDTDTRLRLSHRGRALVELLNNFRP